MANEKFTDLPSVPNATVNDVIAAVQGGVSSQETLQQVIDLSRDNIVLSYPGDPNGNLAGNQYQLCWDTVGFVLYTCNTSGTAATAVWKAASGVPNPLPLAQGGTGSTLTADNGAMVYSSATGMQFLASTASVGQIVRSGSNSAPTWSAATYPSTITDKALMVATGTNAIGQLVPTASAALVANSAGTAIWTSAATNGQVMIGFSGGTPTFANIIQGSNITITEGPGTLEIAATGGGPDSWNTSTSSPVTMVVNNGYISDLGTRITFNLPASAIVGQHLNLIGKGVGGWKIAQAAGQQIQVGSSATTVGVGGSIESSNQFDSLQLICTTGGASTVWTVLGGPQGNITVV